MIQYRLNNIELRETSSLKGGIEIIQWDESHCWTIAYWVKNNDDRLEIKFVGSRPFSGKINWLDFGKLVKTGQIHLDNLNHE
jgi:hypothetical protein